MILVLDFGSQYTQLIARRIREFGVFSQVRPCTISPGEVDLKDVEGLILSGGPASVNDSDAPQFNPEWFSIDKPILGICYGMQLMAVHYGGKLGQGQNREYGPNAIELTEPGPLFKGWKSGGVLPVWMSHGDHVDELPPHFEGNAKSQSAPYAAMCHKELPLVAIQFHPEVVHTKDGKAILKNFLFGMAKCKENWSAHDIVQSIIDNVRREVGQNQNVICALSGGVDSTVAALVVHKALGSRLHCVFVDNGLLREGEAEQVMERMKALGLNVQLADAKSQFLSALHGISNPEQKRKIIGHVFIDVFEEAAKRIPNVGYLVQGTLYPDVIESVSVRGGPSATIKTHHNVGGLPERLNFKLIEPFRELFKDEVRALGREIGIAEEILLRQPFPGPGLAVRVLGEITEARLIAVRKADFILQEEVRKAGLYRELWQSFAVLLPVRSVGVMGDGRTYEEAIAIRAVHSEDGMTADWAYLPEGLLRNASQRIVNEVKGVNRVVLDISSKPPATIEWE